MMKAEVAVGQQGTKECQSLPAAEIIQERGQDPFLSPNLQKELTVLTPGSSTYRKGTIRFCSVTLFLAIPIAGLLRDQYNTHSVFLSFSLNCLEEYSRDIHSEGR